MWAAGTRGNESMDPVAASSRASSVGCTAAPLLQPPSLTLMLLITRIALLAIAAIMGASSTAIAQRGGSTTEARLIAGTAVRVRSAPSLDAPVVGRLRFGSSAILQSREQPRDTTWVKVSAQDALTMQEIEGYIHASLTRRVTRENSRLAVGEAIATERLARRDDDFAQRVELFDWVTRINREHEGWGRPDEERGGRLALLQLRAIIAVLATMPRQSEVLPYDGWVGMYPEIVTRDSAGRVAITPALLDSLHARHLETSSSDEIAWIVYQSAPGTDCPPSLVCELTQVAARDAKYLRDHGAGRYAPRVVKNVTTILGKAVRQPVPSEHLDPVRDCALLGPSLATLRAALEGVAGTERDAALGALEKVAARCPAS